MADRHALFSHYYYASWCLNRSEMLSDGGLMPPHPDSWCSVLQSLRLAPDQVSSLAAARRELLHELSRVAQEWQRVLPTLALQLLQVPRDQWHTVAAVQVSIKPWQHLPTHLVASCCSCADAAVLQDVWHVCPLHTPVHPPPLCIPHPTSTTAACCQSMVANLAAEREAVVNFLHCVLDEVLSPLQEGQLEAARCGEVKRHRRTHMLVQHTAMLCELF